MNAKRMFYAMLVLVVIFFGGVFASIYLALGHLQKQSDKLVDYKLQAAVLEAEQTGLAKAKKDVATYSELEKIAKVIVPQDKDQAQTVREIVKIAADSGITPSSVTFPVSTLGGRTGTGSTAAGGTSGSTSGTTAQNKNVLSQLTPVTGINGVYKLQITIRQDSSSTVPYSKFLAFLEKLEQNRRTAQVSSIILQPDTKNRSMVSFTLTVDEFIKP